MGKKSRRANRVKGKAHGNSNAHTKATIPGIPTLPDEESLKKSREKADSLMGLFLEIDKNVNRWDPERVKALVSYYEVVFRMHVDADKMLKCAPNVKDVTTRQVKLAVLPASASPFE